MMLLRSSRAIRRVSALRSDSAALDIPSFLCPALTRPALRRTFRVLPRVQNEIDVPTTQTPLSPQVPESSIQSTSIESESVESVAFKSKLPAQCPGCGAFSQSSDEKEPGYYALTRKDVKKSVAADKNREARKQKEEAMVKEVLEGLDEETIKSLGLDTVTTDPEISKPESKVPLCDRCHNLIHHHVGNSIIHPSLSSIQETISESPYKKNHIYYVIDAADFPMSVIKNVHRHLGANFQRSQNRRAATYKFRGGKQTDISFIITRSDLLAPAKEQVDRMMPYLREVLREALGGSDKNSFRLGNIRCVSARQNWWTKELKEEIWQRGGANWMVGQVNVGKSRLFHEIFPKGRSKHPEARNADSSKSEQNKDDLIDSSLQALNPLFLLPPAQAEVDFPEMPIVSELPGTTTSPIRVPFGNGKGELIDLPGLSRGELENYLRPEDRSSLLMRTRVKPEQQSLKPGKSLVIGGGLIRIANDNPNLDILAYSFLPIESSIKGTEKFLTRQQEEPERLAKSSILASQSPEENNITSAGKFPLKWDVTRQRLKEGTWLAMTGRGQRDLPFRTLSTDILIQGVGWVELVAQVRAKAFSKKLEGPKPFAAVKAQAEKEIVPETREDGLKPLRRWDSGIVPSEPEDDIQWPEVEVFSPHGKFIAARPPMNAWANYANFPNNTKSRPRRSMKGQKKLAKIRARAAVASS